MNKGDRVIVAYEDKRIPPSEATVISVGRKYITINNIHPDYSKFDLVTHESVDTRSGYNIRAKLYSSIDAYNEEIKEKQLYKELYDKVLSLLKCASIKSLITIKNYLNDKAD